MPKKVELDAETENTMKQFREFLTSYNKLSEHCFVDCIHDLTSRKISDAENACVMNCTDKILRMTERISQRFQEYHTLQTSDMSILGKSNQ